MSSTIRNVTSNKLNRQSRWRLINYLSIKRTPCRRLKIQYSKHVLQETYLRAYWHWALTKYLIWQPIMYVAKENFTLFQQWKPNAFQLKIQKLKWKHIRFVKQSDNLRHSSSKEKVEMWKGSHCSSITNVMMWVTNPQRTYHQKI